jgi:hypothetical protein
LSPDNRQSAAVGQARSRGKFLSAGLRTLRIPPPVLVFDNCSGFSEDGANITGAEFENELNCYELWN